MTALNTRNAFDGEALFSPLLSASLAFISAIWLNHLVPGFFYYDDVQHYFFPLIKTILPSLDHLSVPDITLSTWNAGWLETEWGLGLHNPVTVLSYILFLQSPDNQAAATLLSASYLALMAAGTHLLARHYHCAHSTSTLIATSFALSPFNLYWLASGWWNGMIAMAWVPWAWLYLEKSANTRKDFALAIITSFLLITSGWVHSLLGISIILLFFSYQQRHASIAVIVRPWLAWLLACLASLNVVWPFLTQRDYFFRRSDIWQDFTLTLDINSLIQVSSPFFAPRIHGFNFSITDESGIITYTAWFILPALLMLGKREWKPNIYSWQHLSLMAACFAALTLGPAQLGPTRWPFRFLSFVQLPLLLLAGLVLEKMPPVEFIGRKRTMLITALGITAFLGWQSNPGNLPTALIGLALIAFFTWLIFSEFPSAKRTSSILLVCFLFFFLQHINFTHNDQYHNYRSPPLANSTSPSHIRNTFIYASDTESGLSGNLPLLSGRSIINGYSATPSAALKQQLCLGWSGLPCEKAVNTLFQTDPLTKQTLLSLMGIDEVLANNGVYANSFEKRMGAEWRKASRNEQFTQFIRVASEHDIQTTVTWQSPGIKTNVQGNFSAETEDLRIQSQLAPMTCGLIVFRRAYYPGYSIRLNQNLVEPLRFNHTLLAAKICGPQEGILQLRFQGNGIIP